MNERSMGFPGMWPTNPREDRFGPSPTGIAPTKLPQNLFLGYLIRMAYVPQTGGAAFYFVGSMPRLLNPPSRSHGWPGATAGNFW
jgi:hypothetical protein